MTIFALATAPGRGALAVIRISGDRAGASLDILSGAPRPEARVARVRRLKDPRTGQALDEALVLWMPGPASFTGEDCVELHVHGGIAVTDSILSALAEIEGLSPAEPGAFSRRAVMNGRLDLTAAEGIADLIDAETAAQQSQALRQMQGRLRDLYEGWRDELKSALAHLEADIEFADEDLPGGLGESALDRVETLVESLNAHLCETRGEKLRDGLSIAIIGPPNAGKSSIINALAGRDAAIVSARAGTTRDIVEVAMVLGGVPVTLSDTAGLRDTGDDIEAEGVRRARLRAQEADIRLLVTAYDAPLAQTEAVALLLAGDFWLQNKQDAQSQINNPQVEPPEDVTYLEMSAHDQTSIDAFMAKLEALVAERFGGGERPVLTRARHRNALEEAATHLARALSARDIGLELAAEDLRLASRALGRITGSVDIEALLDVVFADFCIGK